MSEKPTTSVVESTTAPSESTPESLSTVKSTTESAPVVETSAETTKIVYTTQGN